MLLRDVCVVEVVWNVYKKTVACLFIYHYLYASVIYWLPMRCETAQNELRNGPF